MNKGMIARLLLAASLTGGLILDGAARAQDSTAKAACDTAAQEALKKILEALGVPVDAGEVAYDTWADYLKNPNDTKLDAALNTLGQGTAGLVFPAYGVALKGGKIVL